jgi:hypothetical protein
VLPARAGDGDVWLKTSDDFPDDCARIGLSDAGYRTHHEGLSWVMRRENGGHVNTRDLRRFAETSDPDAAVAELVAAGFWRRTPDGWLIVHAMGDQIEPEVMARRRARTRERVRRHRMKAVGLLPADPGNAVTNGVSNGVTERVTRVGSGRDGSGRDRKIKERQDEKIEEPARDEHEPEPAPAPDPSYWPLVRVPGAGSARTPGGCGCRNGQYGEHRGDCPRVSGVG